MYCLFPHVLETQTSGTQGDRAVIMYRSGRLFFYILCAVKFPFNPFAL